MEIRICDRCRVEVVEVPAKQLVLGVTIPPLLPSTNPVALPQDVNLSLTVQSPADLCAPCRLSALVEYVAQQIATSATPDQVKVYKQRFAQVIKG